MKDVIMDKLWDWAKTHAKDGLGDMCLGRNICIDFERYIWLDLGKSTWKSQRKIYQGHMKYIQNDIVKHFRVGTLHYDEHFCEMHDLAKYLPSTSMKGRGFESSDWAVCDK